MSSAETIALATDVAIKSLNTIVAAVVAHDKELVAEAQVSDAPCLSSWAAHNV